MRITGRAPAVWAAAAAAALVVVVAGCSDDAADPQPPDAPPEAQDPVEPGEDVGTHTADPAPTDEPGADGGEDLPPQSVELTGPPGADGDPARAVALEIPGAWTVLDLGLAEPGERPVEDGDDDGTENGESEIGDDAAQTGAPPGTTEQPTDVPDQPNGEATPDPEVPVGQAPQLWCLVPAEEYPALDGCAGVLVAVGGDWLPGAYGMRYVPYQEEGWRPSAEPLLCPFDPESTLDDGEDANLVEPVPGESAPLSSVDTQIGETSMRYEIWRVACSDTEETFTPQVWQAPGLNVLVRDYVGVAETALVLTSIEGLNDAADAPADPTGDATDAPTDGPTGEDTDATDAPTDGPTGDDS